MFGVIGMIVDIFLGVDKVKNFGYMLVIINLGFILGFGFGGFLVEILYRLFFYVVGILGVVVFIMLVLLIYNF